MDWIDASPHVVKDLEDCMDFVWGKLSEKAQKEFMETPVEQLWQFHHGLGRAIRNTLGLWEQEPPPVRLYFEQQLGLTQPDDMSHVIIRALHAKVTGTEYDMQADIEMLKEHWETFNMTDGKND